MFQIKFNLTQYDDNLIELKKLTDEKNKQSIIINDFENLVDDFQSKSYDSYYSRFSDDVLLNINTYNPKTIWYDIENSYFEEKSQPSTTSYNDSYDSNNDNNSDSNNNNDDSSNNDDFFTSSSMDSSSSFKTTDSF